jgi:hypothetical protein
MMTDVIVVSSIGLSAAFFIAWLVRPSFRAWIEQPKHAFGERARTYDRAAVRPSTPANDHDAGNASAR